MIVVCLSWVSLNLFIYAFLWSLDKIAKDLTLNKSNGCHTVFNQ